MFCNAAFGADGLLTEAEVAGKGPNEGYPAAGIIGDMTRTPAAVMVEAEVVAPLLLHAGLP